MIAGILPWRSDVLKKPPIKESEERILLKDGWKYVNVSKILSWRNQLWRLVYKIIDQEPRIIPGFEEIVELKDKYHYIEFIAINHMDGHAELYAYGNLVKGYDRAYVMRGKQLIRME